MRAADDVVGGGAQLSHLTALCRSVEPAQPCTNRVVAPGLVDLSADAKLADRLGEGAVDLGALRDGLEDEPARVLGTVGDLRVEAAASERGSSGFEPRPVGRLFELKVG